MSDETEEKTKAADEIKGAIAGAQEVMPELPPDDVPDEMPDFDPNDQSNEFPTFDWLPRNFPVVPLGVMGEMAYFLDGMNQLREIKFKDFGKMRLQSLFIPQPNIVTYYWPRVDAKGKPTGGWRNEDCSTLLMSHVSQRGIFNPMTRIRGRGAHRSQDNELIWHLGNVVLLAGQPQPPGLLEGYVYPGAERCVKPHADDEIESPGLELKDLFCKWTFHRMAIDPLLLFGWVMAAKMGGALKWRPLVWVTGDKSTGKSTLLDVIKTVLVDVIAVEDATPAGIWQPLGYDTLPVILDELEADADNKRALGVIKLARIAASGGKISRGGENHTGTMFEMHSCFIFSSILHPPLPPQDKSRMAILDLHPIPNEQTAPIIDYKRLRRIGGALMERITRHFHQFDQVLDVYQRALAAVGYGGRVADVFGTLLACAHIGLYDDLPTMQEAKGHADRLAPFLISDSENHMNDASACLHHLLTSEVDPHRSGSKSLVSELIAEASGFNDQQAPDTLAAKALERHGMKVLIPTLVGADGETLKEPLLLVANQHRTLAELFKGTHWQSRVDGPGVWMQALRRVEGASAWATVKFAGVPARSTALSVRAMLDIPA